MTDKIVKAVKVDANGQPIADTTEAATATSTKAPPRFLRERAERTISLIWPIEFDGREYHEVTFHRLTGKDFARLQKARRSGASSEDMMMVSVMTNTPVPVLDALDAEDYMTVMEVLQDFLPMAMLAAGKKKMGELAEEGSSSGSSEPDGGESSSSTGPSMPPS